MKRSINIGLCGLGTVGSGVLKLLQENAPLIQQRVGADIRVIRVATLDRHDNLGLDFSEVVVTDSVDDILHDPDINIVVELIGGTSIAKRIILKAFELEKSVVTANKALLAEFSDEIFRAAYRGKGFFGYEASVAGAIPIIRSIKEGFSGDKIDEISGIINGTANYILSAMTNSQVDFKSALKNAQEKGYAEADPTFDIEGIDSAHKILILMELAFNSLFDFRQLYIEGIAEIEPIDIQIAKEFGYLIKLLAKARNTPRGFEGRVHPALIQVDNMLASVNGVFNAVSIFGNFSGHTMSYGAGAGSHPTASAVVADIVEICRQRNFSKTSPVTPLGIEIENLRKREILPIGEIETEYYLRFTLQKEKESIKHIISLLEENNTSVRSLIRKKALDNADYAENMVVFTGKTLEKDIQAACKRIDALSLIAQPVKLIRIDQ